MSSSSAWWFFLYQDGGAVRAWVGTRSSMPALDGNHGRFITITDIMLASAVNVYGYTPETYAEHMEELSSRLEILAISSMRNA